MKRSHKRLGLNVIRILLGLVFLASGIGKLIDGSDASYLVELMATEFYWLIEYTQPIIIGISVLELILAVLLLWGRQLKWTFPVSFLLVAGFTGILGFFYLQGMNIQSCGCFGAFGLESNLEFTLIRDVALLLLIATGWVMASRETGSESFITASVRGD